MKEILFFILESLGFCKKWKPHFTLEDELLRLKKCSSRERIIGYDKLFRIILGVKPRKSMLSALKKHPVIPAKSSVIGLVDKLHKRRNMLVHHLNNVPDRTLDREADMYEILVKKYLKHQKK